MSAAPDGLAGLQSIPLAALRVSDTGAQAERRKRFDKAAIAELAESIRTVGLLQPLVVRPLDDGFQIIAGERRFLAAQVAGLEVVPAAVRELTDDQVLEVQLIENLQREGLHELVEAEGYEALMKRHSYTVDDLVAKVGKSRAYVYARLKLLALGKDGRKAFYDGKISASIALLLARIPGEKLQTEALKTIAQDRWDGPMSFRRAQEHIQQHYMLRLADAGFPTSDANLIPAAGACGTCPKRTGNQPELFADVKGADVCTDPGCFRAKREAHAARRVEQARAAGQVVIEGPAAKKIAPYGSRSDLKGYVRLDRQVYDDPKHRTARQILGKDAETVLVAVPGDREEASEVIEVVPEQAIRAALKESGVKVERTSSNPEQSAREKKAKRERAAREAIAQAVLAKAQTALGQHLGPQELRDVARGYWSEMQADTKKGLCKFLGWELVQVKSSYRGAYGDLEATAEAQLPKMDVPALNRFLLACVIAGELHVSAWSDAKPESLLRMASRYRVDADKIRRDLAAAEKAKSKKPEAKKAAKKVSKGKKR